MKSLEELETWLFPQKPSLILYNYFEDDVDFLPFSTSISSVMKIFLLNKKVFIVEKIFPTFSRDFREKIPENELKMYEFSRR